MRMSGIVNLLFVVGCAGSSGALGEGVERHLGGYAVAHQHQRAAGQQRRFDGRGVACGHAGKHRLYGSEDGLLCRCLGVERRSEEAGGDCSGNDDGEAGLTNGLHGCRF